MTNLVDGQNLLWPESTARVTLTADRQCDLSALILGPDARVRSDTDFVFYNQPRAASVSWQSGPSQQIDIDLTGLAGLTVVALVSVDPGEPELAHGTIGLTLSTEHGQVASYRPRFTAGERAVTALEFYQRAGAWKVRAFGQGYASGLAELLGTHGVNVEDEQNAQPKVQPPPADLDGELQQRRLVQQIVGILEDLRNSTASFTSTKDYAEHALTRELDELAADPLLRHGPASDQRRAAAQAKHDGLIEQARVNHERDLRQLEAEINTWQREAPAPMVDWTSPQWQSWQPVTEPVHNLVLGSLAPWHAPNLRVPLLTPSSAPLVVWVDTELERENAPFVLRALSTRLLACYPAKTVRVRVVSESPGLLSPLGGPGCAVLSAPEAGTAEAVRALLTDLEREQDLVAMAAEAGVDYPEAAATLLVITDLNLLPDVETLRQLARLATSPNIFVLVAASGTDELAIATPAQIFDECRRIPCSTPNLDHPSEPTEWVLTVDFGDQNAVSAVLARLSRA